MKPGIALKSDPDTKQASAALRADALLVLFLIGFDVAARLLLHAPNVSPVAASALFAGMMLRRRSLAPIVPLAALLIGDGIVGFYDWRVMTMVYAALMLPALAGVLARRRHRTLPVIVPTVMACSLIFFAATNFAVWAFGGMYSADMAGLLQCYVAGLPFLKSTIAGDLFWVAVLFGGAWLVRRLTQRDAIAAAAPTAGARSAGP